MNIKNYLEKNWIYDNEKFFGFFEKYQIKKSFENDRKLIKSYFSLWFLLFSIIFLSIFKDNIYFSFENIFSEWEIIFIIFIYILFCIPIIFYKFFIILKYFNFDDFTKSYKENQNFFNEIYYYKNKSKINYLQIFLETEENFWNFEVKKFSLKIIKFFYFFILWSFLFWFFKILFYDLENLNFKSLLILIFFISIFSHTLWFMYFQRNKNEIETWNEKFNKKFKIFSENKDFILEKRIKRKILELEKTIKKDFSINFSWNTIIIKIDLSYDYFTFSLEKKLLRNYILFKKCEKIFE